MLLLRLVCCTSVYILALYRLFFSLHIKKHDTKHTHKHTHILKIGSTFLFPPTSTTDLEVPFPRRVVYIRDGVILWGLLVQYRSAINSCASSAPLGDEACQPRGGNGGWVRNIYYRIRRSRPRRSSLVLSATTAVECRRTPRYFYMYIFIYWSRVCCL